MMRQGRKRLVVLLAMALAVVGSVPAAGAAPRHGSIRQTSNPVRGSYIVTLRADARNVRTAATDLATRYGGQIDHVYRFALRGFAVRMSERAALALSADARVASVEQDAHAVADSTQSGATWGLDRIDQRNLPLDTLYTYDAAGTGVTAYVIDTGIRTSHEEFGGRAVDGFDAVDGALPAQDCKGHGTHVAGTIGGSTYGVAKDVQLVAVRVLDCNGSGTTSGILAGIDWVTQDHDPGEPAVANMSLGYSGIVPSVDTAVRNSIADGVVYTLSAGNSEMSACDRSPSRVTEGITVGATTQTDVRAWFSNYGSCVDVFAPGLSITSASIASDTSLAIMSGTSMSAPHSAGVAALRLQLFPATSPAKVGYALATNATSGLAQDPGPGSPNRLLYSGFVTAAQPNSPPTVSFSSACSGLICDFTSIATDLDGSVVSRSWNFGDGTSGYAIMEAHTFPQAGTYQVTLTAVDDEGATGSVTASVVVRLWNLRATATKLKGVTTATLTWNAAATSAPELDVYRNGTAWYRVPNTGSFSKNLGKGGATYTYQLCNPGTTRCSEQVRLTT